MFGGNISGILIDSDMLFKLLKIIILLLIIILPSVFIVK